MFSNVKQAMPFDTVRIQPVSVQPEMRLTYVTIHQSALCQHCTSQMAERLGNQAITQKVAGSISPKNDVVSLGKALHPLHPPSGECPCTSCKSLWIKASATLLNVNV